MRRRDRRRTRKFILLVLLPLALALTLIPAALTRPGRVVLSAVTAPVELALSRAFETVAAVPERLRASEELVDSNRRLAGENEELRQRRDLYEVKLVEQAKLIAQLRRVSEVPGLAGKHDLLPAAVVAKDYAHAMGALTARSFTLGVGADDGVREKDLVVAYHAVVGRITVVTSGTARVQPVTDVGFRIPARTVGTGAEAMLNGDGMGGCTLSRYETKDIFREGDRVVTSGFEGAFPPGLLLGTVEKVSGEQYGPKRHVTVKPAVLFDRVSQVIVVRRRGTGP